jgi:hypothetical protein
MIQDDRRNGALINSKWLAKSIYLHAHIQPGILSVLSLFFILIFQFFPYSITLQICSTVLIDSRLNNGLVT